MARICTRCGRPLDGKHHKIDGTRPRLAPVRRGRVGFQTARNYVCRVRAIAEHVRYGRYVPDEHRMSAQGLNDPMQRTKANQSRFVHEDRLKSGGDLHV